VEKLERKRPLGSTRHRWENNIKMDLRVTGMGGRGWIHLALNSGQWWALLKMVMNLQVT
jgi:hypothetical protein